MLKIKFGIHAQSELVQTVFAKIPTLAEAMQKQLIELNVVKNESTWTFEVDYMFIKRDQEEINQVFGPRHKLNFISELLGHETRLEETVKTRFSSRQVKAEYELDFHVPEELDGMLGFIELQFSVEPESFPYLKQFHLAEMKPWETWKDILLRQSEETQRRVFKKALMDGGDFFYEACAKLDTDEARTTCLFENIVSPDLKEFFMEKFNDESISKTDIFSYINHRAKCAEHSNNIFKITEEQA